MNKKYQEALDNIKKAPSFMGGNVKYNSNIQSSIPFLEDIAILQELVDKEKPMEIVCKKSFGLYRTHCPKCDKVINNIKDRCDNCGQRLDWSETNEN